MKLVKTILDTSEKTLAAICVLAFATMLGLGVLTVVFRFVIQSSLAFPDEAIRYLFVWLIALGTAIGLRRNIHAAIGLFVGAMPDVPKRTALIFSSICTIIFLGIVVQKGWHATLSAVDQISPAMEISMAWVFAAIPVGALFGLIYTAEILFNQLVLPASELISDDH